MHTLGFHRLILDVRDNTGGKLLLSDHLLNFLFPYEYPAHAVLEYPQTQTNDEYIESSIDESTIFLTNSSTAQLVHPHDLPRYVKTEGNTTITRTRTWRGLFSFNSDNSLRQHRRLLPEYIRSHGLFTPQDVIILTDGRCGSTCAQFVKHLSERRLARVVGLGGDILSTRVGFDIASYAGGNVANSDSVQRSEISAKPAQFARIGTRISFTLMAGHSYDISNSAAFLDFKIVPPDVLLPHFSSCDDFTDAKMLALIGEVQHYFERCYDWEVNSDLCTPSEEEMITHALYGHPCLTDGTAFDSTRCVFRRCEHGFFLSDAHTCIPVPKSNIPDCPYSAESFIRYSSFLDCFSVLEFSTNRTEISSLIPTLLSRRIFTP